MVWKLLLFSQQNYLLKIHLIQKIFFKGSCYLEPKWESLSRASQVKNPPANARDMGSIPGLGRSPGGGHGNPRQYSCLENPMDRGAWRATVHRISKSQTRKLQVRSLHACNLARMQESPRTIHPFLYRSWEVTWGHKDFTSAFWLPQFTAEKTEAQKVNFIQSYIVKGQAALEFSVLMWDLQGCFFYCLHNHSFLFFLGGGWGGEAICPVWVILWWNLA